jgi:phosphopantetheine--protein transferase-like protein
MIIGIGVDIAEVDRYKFDDLKLQRFAKKVFTEAEMHHAMRYRYPAERLAGAYAAKEATRKAFGHAIPWRLVGVRHHRSGRPYIELLGKADLLLSARGVTRMHLTITHSRKDAVAIVILEGDDTADGLMSAGLPAGEAAAR